LKFADSHTEGSPAVVQQDYATIATIESDGTTLARDGWLQDRNCYKDVVFQPWQGTAARVIAAGKPT